MAKYFLHVRIFSRWRGTRVTRAAAYRAGERIRDERTSEVYDHSDRHDVVHKEIVLPQAFAGRTDTNWARDRWKLWNEAERAGRRRNSRLAREVLVLLPSELASARRVELALRLSRELAERYKNAVDLAVHEPRAGSDERFHHAHLLMTVREVTPEGLGARTTFELRDVERYARGLGPWKAELMWIRQRWAQVVNEALHAAGLEERVDHRSYRDQGIDREPVPTIPKSVYYSERRSGTPHPVGEAIRARYRERLEARRHGADALARVVERQRQEGLTRALAHSARKAALPKKVPRGMLTRDELNRIRREHRRVHAPEFNRKKREWHRAHAAEQNRKHRERRKANAAEINRTRRERHRVNAAYENRRLREWRQAHADEVNRRRREAYHARRVVQQAMKQKPQASKPEAAREAMLAGPDPALLDKGPTAEVSAKQWQESRELWQHSRSAEESARQCREYREGGEHSPTAEESSRSWLQLREDQNNEAAASTSDEGSLEHKPAGKADAEDDDEIGRSNRDRDDAQGL
jgi:hypothetical protein